MTNKVIVAGVGMTPFKKPGQSETYDLMGAAAVRSALADANCDYSAVQAAHVAFTMCDSGAAQQTLYKVGLTGLPITNVSNACASGTTALYLAFQAVKYGAADCVLALGFEQMFSGALPLSGYEDRPPIVEKHLNLLPEEERQADFAPLFRFYGAAGQEYCDRYGLDPAIFADVTVKARRHGQHNPLAIFREPVTREYVLASRHIYGPLTKLQCCPPTSGAAAALVVSEHFARQHGMNTMVEIAAMSLRSDGISSFESGSMMNAVGYDMVVEGARDVYTVAGIGPDDVDVIELTDNFSCNELITYDALGLCAKGNAGQLIQDGDTTYGGRFVVNPSGGMLSRGHPLGATGLAQCAELTWQLRGTAEKRQVEGARIGLQQTMGFTNAGGLAVYKRT
jgi:sterol carrier protein 2